MRLVVLGLSLSSAWGNGHATTYRALLRAFSQRGHRVLFLEADVPRYAAHRDFETDFCNIQLYRNLDDLRRFDSEIAAADAVMVGSYVPDGIRIGHWIQAVAEGI